MVIGCFEEPLAAEAKRCGVGGIICGQIHSAAIRHFEDFSYINTGDWVEHCMAVVGRRDDCMEVIHWQAFSRVFNASRVPSVAL